MEEELNFAGHPLLGLASLIHDIHFNDNLKNKISIELNSKSVDVTTIKNDEFFSASMNQGTPIKQIGVSWIP